MPPARERDKNAMNAFLTTNAQATRRFARNRYRPSVDTLDDRVLPSAGLSPVASAASLYHLKALAAAQNHVSVNVHRQNHPILAQQRLVAQRTVSRSLPPRAPAPHIRVAPRPLPIRTVSRLLPPRTPALP